MRIIVRAQEKHFKSWIHAPEDAKQEFKRQEFKREAKFFGALEKSAMIESSTEPQKLNKSRLWADVAVSLLN